MADELRALFQTFDLRETKEHEKFKGGAWDEALEKYRGSLPNIADLMDTGDEHVDRYGGLCFLYMECPVMANCLAKQCLVSNMSGGGISVTNLPPCQADVTFSEVSNVLGSLGEGSIINYGDPYRNSYFAAFVPTNRFQHFYKIQPCDREWRIGGVRRLHAHATDWIWPPLQDCGTRIWPVSQLMCWWARL